jgi:hypothetical protein
LSEKRKNETKKERKKGHGTFYENAFTASKCLAFTGIAVHPLHLTE